jgi:hypothetical protein
MDEKRSGSTKCDCYNPKFKGLCKVLSRKISFHMIFIKLIVVKITQRRLDKDKRQ